MTGRATVVVYRDGTKDTKETTDTKAGAPSTRSSSLETVAFHSHVELRARQAQLLRGLRLVEARVLERRFDHRALDGLKVAAGRGRGRRSNRGRWQGHRRRL